MHPEAAFTFVSVEAVSQGFQLADMTYCSFLEIDFQKELIRNKWHDLLQRSFRTLPAFAQNHAVVGVSDELMPSSLQFLIQFVKHDVPTQRT